MVIRLCSILGTLAILLAAHPASAAGGKKKGKRADKTEQTEAAQSESDKEGAAAEGDEFAASDDSWEAPPAEDEAPPADAPPPLIEAPPKDTLPISAALLLGWGFKTDRRTGGFGADPYGLAFGARGGYVLQDLSLYVGAYFMYFLGGSAAGEGTTSGAPVGFIESSANYMNFGAEVGYDAWIGPIVLRPSLQVGAALVLSTVDGKSQTIGDLSFNPGVTLIHPIDEFFLGGDARATLVMGDGVSAVTLLATGGMRFE